MKTEDADTPTPKRSRADWLSDSILRTNWDILQETAELLAEKNSAVAGILRNHLIDALQES